MVTKEDLYNEAEYADIKEDVRLECLQYGKVLSVVMPRVKEGYSPAAECLIFVEFETVEGAGAAAKVLNGRKFAENVVHVAYVSSVDPERSFLSYVSHAYFSFFSGFTV